MKITRRSKKLLKETEVAVNSLIWLSRHRKDGEWAEFNLAADLHDGSGQLIVTLSREEIAHLARFAELVVAP